jgi:hypothetical protein
MRIFIFRSDGNRELHAFAGDREGSSLPPQHGPWRVTGVVSPGNDPPHNLDRGTIEAAIADEGFQLWRMRLKKAVPNADRQQPK